MVRKDKQRCVYENENEGTNENKSDITNQQNGIKEESKTGVGAINQKGKLLNKYVHRPYLNPVFIKFYLTKRNENLVWLADNIGISRQYLWQLMTWKRVPSTRLRKRIMSVIIDIKFDKIFVLMKVKCNYRS